MRWHTNNCAHGALILECVSTVVVNCSEPLSMPMKYSTRYVQTNCRFNRKERKNAIASQTNYTFILPLNVGLFFSWNKLFFFLFASNILTPILCKSIFDTNTRSPFKGNSNNSNTLAVFFGNLDCCQGFHGPGF